MHKWATSSMSPVLIATLHGSTRSREWLWVRWGCVLFPCPGPWRPGQVRAYGRVTAKVPQILGETDRFRVPCDSAVLNGLIDRRLESCQVVPKEDRKRRPRRTPVTACHTAGTVRTSKLSCLFSFSDDTPTISTIHTIFEGTSEIQQLVIARAISGMRVE